MAKRIAIVEDDPDQRSNYVDAITKKGYDVTAYSSRQEALRGFERELPDLAILDIILGDEVDAGFEICRDLLAKSASLPVIFLTERIDEIDKISGLRLGAWDYLPKPISLDYLAERISSLLRIHEARGQSQGGSATAKMVGEMSIDQEALLVSWKHQPINLSGTEFRMLAKLVRVPGHAVSYDNTINTHMRNIRKKFESVDPQFNCIKSEYGFGYRWSAK
jgi:two-component system, OmpR family, response regulator